MYEIIKDLEELQQRMEEKALSKDPSIVMDVLRLDEIIEELKDEI